MSVRRLAHESHQPADFAFSQANSAVAKQWIKKYPKGRQASAVIPLLMIAQEQDGWVTRASIEYIAEMLEMPYIRVLEVASFYTQFMLQPVGSKAHIQVCGTTPCMLRGSEALMKVCKKKIHPEQFHTNEEGTLSWEEVECQGACVNGPMVMIFKDAYEDLTPERLAEIIDEFEAGRGDAVNPGPQIDRIFGGPEGGLTTLTDESAIIVKPNAKVPSGGKSGTSKAKLSSKAKPKPAKKPEAKPAKQGAKASGTPQPMGIASFANRPGPRRQEKPTGEADDLKLINGVGPKLEKTLNTLGFWHFAQIAEWTQKDIAIVDDELSFKGRIERDDWVKQAKALARGGREEYIRVFGKEPR